MLIYYTAFFAVLIITTIINLAIRSNIPKKIKGIANNLELTLLETTTNEEEGYFRELPTKAKGYLANQYPIKISYVYINDSKQLQADGEYKIELLINNTLDYAFTLVSKSQQEARKKVNVV